MIRVHEIEICNVRSIAHQVLAFDSDGITAIVGPIGSGKCLPAGTPIWEPDSGRRVPIEEFVRARRTQTLGPDLSTGRIGIVPVTDWHALGEKELVEVTTVGGSQITVAATHPILTDVGCKRAAELAPGEDWIGLARWIPSAPTAITPEEAALAGLLLGDGCLTEARCVLSAIDGPTADWFAELVPAVFPGAAVATYASNKRTLVNADRKTAVTRLLDRLRREGVPLDPQWIRRNSGPSWEALQQVEHDFGLDLWAEKCGVYAPRVAGEWLAEMGLAGANSRTKRIPDAMFMLPDAAAANLIAGLWMTDGWTFSPPGRGGRSMGLATVSKHLARGVRLVLRRLGITSRMSVKENAHGYVWTVSINSTGVERFAEVVPLRGYKAEALAAEVERRRSRRSRRENVDTMPPRLVLQNLDRMPGARANRSATVLAKCSMQRDVFLKYGGPPEIGVSDFQWDRVKSVVPAGRAECFDITVDTDDHLYLTDEFIVHNSSIFDALAWCLYGTRPSGTGTLDDLRRTTAPGSEPMEVTVTFTVGETAYRAARRRTTDGESTAALTVNGVPQAGITPRTLTDEVAAATGLRGAAFAGAHYMPQGQLTRLVEGAPAVVQEVFEEQTGLAALAARIVDARGARDRAKRAADALPGDPDEAHAAEAQAAEVSTEAVRLAAVATASCDAVDRGAATAAALLAERRALHAAERAAGEARAARSLAESACATADRRVDEAHSALEALGVATVAAVTADDSAVLGEWERESATHARQAADRLLAAEARLAGALDATVTLNGSVGDAEAHADRERHAAEAAEQATGHANAERARAARAVEAVTTVAEPVCPTCRQPLSDPDALRAELRDSLDAAEATARQAADARAEAHRRAATAAATAEGARHAEGARGAALAATTAVRDLLNGAVLADPSPTAVREAAGRALTTLHATATRHDRAAVLYAELATASGEQARAAVDAQAVEARTTEGQAPDPAMVDEADRRADDAQAQLGALTRQAADDRAAARIADAEWHAADRHAAEQRARVDAKTTATRAAETARLVHEVLAALRRDLLADYTDAASRAASDVLLRLGGEHIGFEVAADFKPHVILPSGAARPTRVLSGGEKARAALAFRLGIARQVAGGRPPGMLFADEVTAAYDEPTRRTVLRLLRNLGVPLVIVSHTAEAEEVATRVLRLTRPDGEPTVLAVD